MDKISAFRTNSLIPLCEAKAYADTLDKTTFLYQEIHRLQTLPPGIYQWGELKISTLENFLPGGLFGAQLLNALKNSKPDVKEKGGLLWEKIFKAQPKTEQENAKAIDQLNAQLAQLGKKAENIQRMLNKVEETMENALKEKDYALEELDELIQSPTLDRAIKDLTHLTQSGQGNVQNDTTITGDRNQSTQVGGNMTAATHSVEHSEKSFAGSAGGDVHIGDSSTTETYHGNSQKYVVSNSTVMGIGPNNTFNNPKQG